MKRILVALAVVVLWAGGVFAQSDLDSAITLWRSTVLLLGQSPNVSATWTAFDSLNDVRPAVNAGLRKVAVDVGVTAFDTITIVDGTFFYTLNTNFIDNGTARMPFQAFRVSADGASIQGLKQSPAPDFGTTPTGTALGSPTTQAVGYGVTGNRFWLYPAGDNNDKVYLQGPADATVMMDGADTTNVYPEDPWGAVYWAAYLLANARGYPNAATYQAMYFDYVERRTGVRPQQ